MALSKRETWIAVIAALAVALLVADRYLITPLMQSGAALDAEQQRLVGQMENAGRLFERRRLMGHKWQEMTAGGLASDPSQAEGRVLHAVRNWAEDAGLLLSSVKPERRDQQEGGMGQIAVQAAGTGNMRSVARFLWQVETSTLPVRIREVQLGSRTEGADDLSLQLKLSTLYAGPSAGEPARSGEES